MWFIAIVVLCANGVMGENKCETPHFIACNYPLSPDLPETAKELEEMCPLVMNYFDCVKDYEDMCKDKGPMFRNGEYESIRNLILDVCSNGTRMHKVVFENIKCIKDRFSNRGAECGKTSHQVVDAFKDFKRTTKVQEEARVARMKENCLFFTYDLGCFMTAASNKCGPMVKDVIIEAANRFGFLPSQCSKGYMNELEDITNSLKISDAQKKILNESLRTFAWKD